MTDIGSRVDRFIKKYNTDIENEINERNKKHVESCNNLVNILQNFKTNPFTGYKRLNKNMDDFYTKCPNMDKFLKETDERQQHDKIEILPITDEWVNSIIGTIHDQKYISYQIKPVLNSYY